MTSTNPAQTLRPATGRVLVSVAKAPGRHRAGPDHPRKPMTAESINYRGAHRA